MSVVYHQYYSESMPNVRLGYVTLEKVRLMFITCIVQNIYQKIRLHHCLSPVLYTCAKRLRYAVVYSQYCRESMPKVRLDQVMLDKVRQFFITIVVQNLCQRSGYAVLYHQYYSESTPNVRLGYDTLEKVRLLFITIIVQNLCQRLNYSDVYDQYYSEATPKFRLGYVTLDKVGVLFVTSILQNMQQKVRLH